MRVQIQERLGTLNVSLAMLIPVLVVGVWSGLFAEQNAWQATAASPLRFVVVLLGFALGGWIGAWFLAERRALHQPVLIGCLVNTVMLAGLWQYGVEVTGAAAMASYAAAAAAFAAVHWMRDANVWLLAALGATVVGLAGASSPRAVALLPTNMAAAPTATRAPLDTSLYGLELRTYRKQLPAPVAMGGGLAPLPDERILAVTGDGDFYLLQEDADQLSLAVSQVPMRVPINSDRFREFAESVAADAGNFRVHDLLVTIEDAVATVLVSHHHFREQQACTTVRVSRTTMAVSALLVPQGDIHEAEWSTLFETSPCLPMKQPPNPFEGSQAGRRLALLDDNTLLLTVGDHQFDSVNADIDLPQDPTADYGKILVIDLASGDAEVFSTGHRNPQGLLVTAEGRIWATEHGPQGGDELNLIIRGANYGWPLVSYGTDYDARIWPPSGVQGRHDGFAEPTYAWTPSIAVTDLIQPEHADFELWHGDLIIGSMRAGSLFRMRLVDDKPVLVEPIEIFPYGVRDLAETASGKLALWGKADGVVGFISRRSPDASGAASLATCNGCHAIGSGRDHGIGPDLHGIIGRRIGGATGFRYSAALADADGRWTEEALDAFLAQPQSFLPGNTMQFEGIADVRARRELIAQLKAL